MQKLPRVQCNTLWVEIFPSPKMAAILNFRFLAKIRKFKMAAIFGEGKISSKFSTHRVSQIPCGSKIYEIALFPTVKEIEGHFVLPFLAKIRKFKMAAIFGEGKFSTHRVLRIAFLRYPVGRKFRRNRKTHFARLRR